MAATPHFLYPNGDLIPPFIILAKRRGTSYNEIRMELKNRYDGYHFSENLEDIYNPFCLVNVFAANKFSNYWINSGTPTYVVKLLKNYKNPLRDIEEVKIKATRLVSEGILSKELVPTLYQTGYLTIKSYNERFNQYILGYPNIEVEEGFIDFLMPVYFGSGFDNSEFSVDEFIGDVQNGNPDRFMQRIDSMLSGVPHLGKEDAHEHTFQNAIYLIFKMIGFYARVEDHTSDGRIDLVIKTKSFVYIFEFKIDRSARVALDQIIAKEYWKKFASDGKRIFLIGANFNTDKKNIDDVLIETIG